MKAKFLLTVTLILTTVGTMAQKYAGGDISLLTEYEEHGAIYYDTDGETQIDDLLTYFSEQGHNAMRVRLFHTPSNAPEDHIGEGVVQDLPYVAELGKRIKDAGFSFMLDIHYSDTWADPSKQYTPRAWEDLDDDLLCDSVYEYTKMVLEYLNDNGATPDFIQTGNEISYGMLWGGQDASTSTLNANKYYADGTESDELIRFTNILKKATTACREVCPDAKIILHTERVARPAYITTFYQDMDNQGVDYDIIGTSYYSYYHGPLSQLETALTYIENNFSKEIMVVETGYYHAWQPSSVDYDLSDTYPISDEGQQAFTEDLIELLNEHSQVTGLFWWDMEANEYGLDWTTNRVTDDWYNAGLFDNSTGKAMGAITVLKDFLEDNSSGISTVTVDDTNLSDDNVYTLSGMQTGTSLDQLPKGIYITQGKKIIVK